ncbi:MAG TPA: hypothetical protein VFQ36_00990 [Ktedonobacteraceae bacterium]|nr:hypothetical protein [Ktedonobacteraceae bacterium]
MLDESRFVFLKSDSTGSQAAITLQHFRERLIEVRALFQYGMSQRDITQRNLVSLEKELRGMIGSIDRSSNMKNLLISADASQEALQEVITRLNLAADLLDMQITPKRREMLYQKYREISKSLTLAIQRLQSKQ